MSNPDVYRDAHIWHDVHDLGSWRIQVNLAGGVFLIANYKPSATRREPRSQFCTLYEDGHIGLDFPEGVPEYVKHKLRVMAIAKRNCSPLCCRVEYDLGYYGGDYDRVGDFAYVPWERIHELGIDYAFKLTTGHDPVHIVHYDSEQQYVYHPERERWEGV